MPNTPRWLLVLVLVVAFMCPVALFLQVWAPLVSLALGLFVFFTIRAHDDQHSTAWYALSFVPFVFWVMILTPLYLFERSA